MLSVDSKPNQFYCLEHFAVAYSNFAYPDIAKFLGYDQLDPPRQAALQKFLVARSRKHSDVTLPFPLLPSTKVEVYFSCNKNHRSVENCKCKGLGYQTGTVSKLIDATTKTYSVKFTGRLKGQENEDIELVLDPLQMDDWKLVERDAVDEFFTD